MKQNCIDCGIDIESTHGHIKRCKGCKRIREKKLKTKYNHTYAKKIYRNNGIKDVKKVEADPYLKVINEISKLPMGAW